MASPILIRVDPAAQLKHLDINRTVRTKPPSELGT